MSGEERIRAAFTAAKDEGRAALMPYMMAGFPDRDSGLAVARAYVDAGADLIELGVPFSDPLAGGPTIHSAATQALAEGATLRTALEVCEAVGDQIPVVLMVYVNMVLAHGGGAEFAKLAAAAGAAGVIVPDLPLGQDEGIRDAFTAAGIAMVPLVAPTTPDARRKEVRDVARGGGARRSAPPPAGSSTSPPPSAPRGSAASCRRSSPIWSPRRSPTRGRP